MGSSEGAWLELWTEAYERPTNGTPPTNTNCTLLPVYEHRFVVALTSAVVVTSLLSVFGSGLIIFTYAAFKNLRTVAREILVQLSIADIVMSVSHIVGVLGNLPRFIPQQCEAPESIANITNEDIACKIQGGTTMFGTISSFLWTIAVAVYLLMIIVFEKQKLARWLRFTFYPICWGIPFALVVWFGINDYLGFEESVDIGKSITQLFDIIVNC